MLHLKLLNPIFAKIIFQITVITESSVRNQVCSVNASLDEALVMGNDNDCRFAVPDEFSQGSYPVIVKIVRRLVKQQDVKRRHKFKYKLGLEKLSSAQFVRSAGKKVRMKSQGSCDIKDNLFRHPGSLHEL